MKLGMLSILVLVVSFGVAHAETWPADSSLRLCNNTTDKVLQTAYAMQATAGWQSQGWAEVKPQACKRFELGSYKGKIYLYAEYNRGEMYWGSGPTNFCVNKTKDFSIENALDGTKCDENINQKVVPA